MKLKIEKYIIRKYLYIYNPYPVASSTVLFAEKQNSFFHMKQLLFYSYFCMWKTLVLLAWMSTN